MGKWIVKLLAFTVTCLLVLELMFRFVFPACELPASVQIPGGFLVSDAGYQQSGDFTLGRVPTEGYHWNINNDGWNSIFTYEPIEERIRPLIALIGDSSVEGHWCNVEDHIDSWLHRLLEGSFDVYAFGRGGMPLAQMMVLVETVDSLYRPDLFVIMLGHEVINGSLVPDLTIEYHYIVPVPALGTFLVMQPSDREPSPFARTAMRSATVRYVSLHLQVDLFPLMNVFGKPINLNAGLNESRVHELLPMAARFMLNRISEAVGERRLLVVVDNWMDRHTLYGNEDVSFVVRKIIINDMKALTDACSDFRNIDYLGTDDAFRQAWDSTENSFDAADGRHLNSYGNYVTAAAIRRQLSESGAFSEVLSKWASGNPPSIAPQEDHTESPES